jgi:periplasmic protein TonB
MSNRALAYSTTRRTHRARLRKPGSQRVVPLRPWSDVPVSGTALQSNTPQPPHIKRWHIVALIAAALAVHGAVVWFVEHAEQRAPKPRASQLAVEIVRPPKPPEPPKPEPPKPPPPKAPPRQTRVLPQIQQSEPLASTVGESTEPPVAVAPSAPEPAPPPPPPKEEPITEPIGRAGYLNNPAPDYPAQAVRQGWQGTVLLRVHVLANGTVESVEIKQSSGRRVLDDEAVRTVKRWSFTPSRRGTTPIDGWATVPIEFLLDQ